MDRLINPEAYGSTSLITTGPSTEPVPKSAARKTGAPKNADTAESKAMKPRKSTAARAVKISTPRPDAPKASIANAGHLNIAPPKSKGLPLPVIVVVSTGSIVLEEEYEFQCKNYDTCEFEARYEEKLKQHEAKCDGTLSIRSKKTPPTTLTRLYRCKNFAT